MTQSAFASANLVSEHNPHIPHLRNALKARIPVPDAEFDSTYPDSVREVSSRFWTPVEVALRAAELLVVDDRTRVLDVGSGAGKFCVIGALATGASFTGIEHRPHLIDVARESARKWQASGVTFVQGRFHIVSWNKFDAFYFYNPFQEGVFSRAEQLDDTVELSLERYRVDLALARGLLAAAKIGTRVATYHSLGGRMPSEYRLLASQRIGTDRLQLWVKQSNDSIRACAYDDPPLFL